MLSKEQIREGHRDCLSSDVFTMIKSRENDSVVMEENTFEWLIEKGFRDSVTMDDVNNVFDAIEDITHAYSFVVGTQALAQMKSDDTIKQYTSSIDIGNRGSITVAINRTDSCPPELDGVDGPRLCVDPVIDVSFNINDGCHETLEGVRAAIIRRATEMFN